MTITIKQLKQILEQRIEEEKKLASAAPCKYCEGVHDGHASGLAEVSYYLTLLEGYNEAGSN